MAYAKHDTRHWLPDFDLDKATVHTHTHTHTRKYLYTGKNEQRKKSDHIRGQFLVNRYRAVSRAEKWRKCLNSVRRFGARRWKRGLSESKRIEESIFSSDVPHCVAWNRLLLCFPLFAISLSDYPSRLAREYTLRWKKMDLARENTHTHTL